MARFDAETVESDVPNIFVVNHTITSSVLKKPARAKPNKRKEGWEEDWDEEVKGEDEDPDEQDELGAADGPDAEEAVAEPPRKRRSVKSQDVRAPGGTVAAAAPVVVLLPAPADVAVASNAAAATARIYPAQYMKMWYKANSSYGIRRCFGDKKQLFTIRSPSKTMSQQELCEVADNVLMKLRGQELSESEAKDWAVSQVR